MNEYRPVEQNGVLGRLKRELERRRRWSGGRIAVLVAGLLVLAGALWLVFLQGGKPDAYTTVPARRGPLIVTVSATGSLQPETQVNVGAEVSGRIDAVNVDFNDHVTKDQVLAVINTDQLRALLAQAKAALNAARANVLTTQATVTETLQRRDRARSLYPRGGVSAQDLQTAEADHARAIANLAKAKADVENAAAQVANYQTTIGKAEVLSPINGIVLDRKVEPGQTVAATFQTPVLFTLASDLSRMQLQVDIDEADIGNVREGETATFTVDAYPQHRFEARLIALRNAPKTENGVVTYQGVLAVDNSAHLLRPGLTANVQIMVAESKDALLVPNGALRFTPPANAAPFLSGPSPPSRSVQEGFKGRVWVLKDQGPEPRDLILGHSDGRSTEVLSGPLAVGEPVIVDIAARQR